MKRSINRIDVLLRPSSNNRKNAGSRSGTASAKSGQNSAEKKSAMASYALPTKSNLSNPTFLYSVPAARTPVKPTKVAKKQRLNKLIAVTKEVSERPQGLAVKTQMSDPIG